MDSNHMIDLAKALTSVAGVAGRENPAAQVAMEYLKPLGEVQVSPLGNVSCTVCTGKQGGRHIMLEAHLDRIGLVVSRLEENGFLRVANVGGFDRRLLPAAPVTIHAESGTYAGVIGSVPPHLADAKDKPLKIEELAVDTGYSTEEAKKLFCPGDIITLDSSFITLAGGRFAAAAMDDRIGCVAVIAAAEEIKKLNPDCRVTVLLSVQEETGGAGARTSAFAIAPDEAIAVDVSFGEGFGSPAVKCGKMGGGTMIGIAPILNRAMTRKLIELATRHEIPNQTEVMGGSTGTDADGIAISAGGVKTALLSIPLLNMHTVVETASVEDVCATARLMVEYVKEVSAK
ncbi:MAG: M20/M25/M40 family metallo-hydrolase [Angelakisella sp.]